MSSNQSNIASQILNSNFKPEEYEQDFKKIFDTLKDNLPQQNSKHFQLKLQQILRDSPKDGRDLFSRDELISGYNLLVKKGLLQEIPTILEFIKLKPVRTISGVTPVTVLTKPFPCPGQCIFCPNDVRMPKSYIASEPGAQRAGRNAFDPYLQTYNRLLALKNIGHRVDKVELIVLGGTWSFYPESYQIWFIKRCFEAMNDFGVKDARPQLEGIDFNNPYKDTETVVNYNTVINSNRSADNGIESATWEELNLEHIRNETAECRNVGLVLETRPDFLYEKEVVRLRKLGATKIQIGVQSLNDEVLDANKRGTTVKQIARAFSLLRSAGFKIHVHMMPNLYKATPESDLEDYKLLFSPEFSPDEVKIYPTSIIKGTLLYDYFKKGDYRPYTQSELNELLKKELLATPRYCRLTRIIRDIPSQEIAAGNKTTNFRQLLELELIKAGTPCQCIRCREIKNKQIQPEDLELEIIKYRTISSDEIFISYRTKTQDKIAGFLRLTLSDKLNISESFLPEIDAHALIREVHVYGQVAGLGVSDKDHTQHTGIGKKLIEQAEEISRKRGFKEISVISAIGTRNYYRKLGYKLNELYLSKTL